MMPTQAEKKAALGALFAITEAIREAKEIPEGTLYAVVMGRCELPAFESMIRTIVNTGLVEKRGNLLRWVGPEVN